MLYIFLTIIIVLLSIIIYQRRDRGATFNKLFSPIKRIEDYERDENLSKIKPDGYVKFMHRYMKRHEADEEEERLRKLYTDVGTTEEDIVKLLYPNKKHGRQN